MNTDREEGGYENLHAVHGSNLLGAKWHKFLVIAVAIVVRAAVGLHPYSGENTPPMYGDYEAQRHWMELALNVPPRDWYEQTANNNLSYWGLDYPPLSGYASWLCGKFLNFTDPQSVALHTSHGFESELSRAAMRTTVLVSDALVYYPALAHFNLLAIANAVLMPGLILMDHGHFQYNAVSLGLCVLAFELYRRKRDAYAAAVFCAAVYFKHLCLYFSLALFSHHSAQLLRLLRSRRLRDATMYVTRVFCAISIVTTITFAPWIGNVQLMKGLLRRLFPVSRGLYEDKVANFWCSISVIVKVHRFMTRSQIVVMCAICTVVFSLPFCAAIFRRCIEMSGRTVNPKNFNAFLLACTGCALSAFLFSFHVHEKQILIPLISLSLLFDTYPKLCTWMALAASASLFPLLVREGLVLPYFAVNSMYLCVMSELWPQSRTQENSNAVIRNLEWLVSKLEIPAFIIGLILHATLLFAQPPAWAKDIFVLLLTDFSCLIFLGVYAALIVQLWIPEGNSEHKKRA